MLIFFFFCLKPTGPCLTQSGAGDFLGKIDPVLANQLQRQADVRLMIASGPPEVKGLLRLQPLVEIVRAGLRGTGCPCVKAESCLWALNVCLVNHSWHLPVLTRQPSCPLCHSLHCVFLLHSCSPNTTSSFLSSSLTLLKWWEAHSFSGCTDRKDRLLTTALWG